MIPCWNSCLTNFNLAGLNLRAVAYVRWLVVGMWCFVECLPPVECIIVVLNLGIGCKFINTAVLFNITLFKVSNANLNTGKIHFICFQVHFPYSYEFVKIQFFMTLGKMLKLFKIIFFLSKKSLSNGRNCRKVSKTELIFLI